MNHKIEVLDKNIANQIAAGEVAERPALVLKELLENAIDAGATSIRVLLKNSGFDRIRIIDNGIGIAKDDIHTAFLRHATSKLRQIEDLNHLYTMGFRGEALASIAAVSKVKITTKTAEGDSGFSAVVIDGEFGELLPAPCNNGTEIIVDDLFYNTPARKKFLATPTRELREISDLMGKITIANANIAFELTNNGKLVFRSSGSGKMKDAIMAVYGRDMTKKILPVNHEMFHGYIAHPSFHKPNRSYYHFYINHRYIQNDILNRTLEEAYRTLMPERRFPVAFIDITVNPSNYDINVHPNKLEVKFNKESEIPQKLFGVLKETLADSDHSYQGAGHSSEKGADTLAMPEFSYAPSEEKKERPIIHGIKSDKFSMGGAQMGFSDLKGGVPQEFLAIKDEAGEEDVPLSQKLRDDFKTMSESIDSSFIQLMDSNSDEEDAETKEAEQEPSTQDHSPAEEFFPMELFQSSEGLSLQSQFDTFEKSRKLDMEESFYSSLEILGQLAASFIIAADSDALYIIDQHAAHERLLYNSIRKAVSKESIDTQPLLVPLEMNVNHKQYGWIIENIINLRDLGFILEEFGDQCFIIREVPTWAKDVDYVAFLLELADGFIEEGRPLTVEEIKDSRIATRACKSAIKANRFLTKSDIHYLFTELDMAEDAFTCPHGRPITIKYEVAEIRRKFLRT